MRTKLTSNNMLTANTIFTMKTSSTKSLYRNLPHRGGDDHREEAKRNDEDRQPPAEPMSEKEQLKVVLQALCQLAQVASMETAEYQQSLKKSKAKTLEDLLSTTTPSSPLAAQRKPSFLTSSSSNLSKQTFLLKETPVLRLQEAIQRLFSRVCVLEEQVDMHERENTQLQEQAVKMQEEKEDLEKAVQTLHQQNQRLSKKLKQRHKTNKALAKQNCFYLQQWSAAEQERQRLDMENAAYQVKTHEQSLLLLPQNKRVRLGSQDSTISTHCRFQHQEQQQYHHTDELEDLDASLRPWPMDPFGTSSPRSRRGSMATEEEVFTFGGAHEDGYDDETAFSMSCSSGVTFVTDDGVPTVRFDSPFAEEKDDDDYRQDDNDHVLEKETTYTFTRGTRMGLKLRAIPLGEDETDPHHSNTKGGGLLNDVFLQDADHPATSPRRQHHQPRSEHSLLSLSPKRAATAAASGGNGRAIVVSGLNGSDFESHRNPNPPAVGSRVVAIQGERVDDSWTMDQVTERLSRFTRSQSSTGLSSTYTVTFRNVPLTEKQLNVLHKQLPSTPCSSPVRAPKEKRNPSASSDRPWAVDHKVAVRALPALPFDDEGTSNYGITASNSPKPTKKKMTAKTKAMPTSGPSSSFKPQCFGLGGFFSFGQANTTTTTRATTSCQ